MKEFQALQDFLATLPPGPVADRSRVVELFSACWEEFQGSSEASMRSDKLWRMETPEWNPPLFEFWIERHGSYVMGSTRAELQKWSVDLDQRAVSIIGSRRRQLNSAAKSLDVKPLAEKLAQKIIEGRSESGFTIQPDGTVRINIGAIIPETTAQTTIGRRRRFRDHLVGCLAPHGWRQIRPNVFSKT